MTRSSFTPIALLLTLLLPLLVGCGGGASSAIRSNFVEFTPEQISEIERSSKREYRLQANDVLRVSFAHNRELNPDPVLVLPDGAVSLVGVDRLEVAGLTITEADSLITAAYSREYKDPQISVMVLESRGRQVYVLGEVLQPGLVTLPRGGLSIVGAVALAGGFGEHASRENAVLVRVTATGYLVQEMNLGKFQSADFNALATVELQPYDVVYVPRSKIGDFSYFARSILAGLVNITRVASDARYLTDSNAGRY